MPCVQSIRQRRTEIEANRARLTVTVHAIGLYRSCLERTKSTTMTGRSSSEVITSQQQIFIKAQRAAELRLFARGWSIVRAHPGDGGSAGGLQPVPLVQPHRGWSAWGGRTGERESLCSDRLGNGARTCWRSQEGLPLCCGNWGRVSEPMRWPCLHLPLAPGREGWCRQAPRAVGILRSSNLLGCAPGPMA